jgi:osmotically-inducible protein OsmY
VLWLLTLPFRVFGLGVKVGHRTTRLVGYKRLLLVLVGVGIGLLVAPVPGDRMRAKLRRVVEDLAGKGTTDLAQKVRDELSSAPRTWHLPQPDVVATQGRIVLTGEVPHATAKGDLERVAANVKGVQEVDNQLRVASN